MSVAEKKDYNVLGNNEQIYATNTFWNCLVLCWRNRGKHFSKAGDLMIKIKVFYLTSKAFTGSRRPSHDDIQWPAVYYVPGY